MSQRRTSVQTKAAQAWAAFVFLPHQDEYFSSFIHP
jgi:hypothetical protein